MSRRCRGSGPANRASAAGQFHSTHRSDTRTRRRVADRAGNPGALSMCRSTTATVYGRWRTNYPPVYLPTAGFVGAGYSLAPASGQRRLRRRAPLGLGHPDWSRHEVVIDQARIGPSQHEPITGNHIEIQNTPGIDAARWPRSRLRGVAGGTGTRTARTRRARSPIDHGSRRTGANRHPPGCVRPTRPGASGRPAHPMPPRARASGRAGLRYASRRRTSAELRIGRARHQGPPQARRSGGAAHPAEPAIRDRPPGAAHPASCPSAGARPSGTAARRSPPAEPAHVPRHRDGRARQSRAPGRAVRRLSLCTG